MSIKIVPEFSDRLSELFSQALDGNLHIGYWEDPTISQSFTDAADSLTDQIIARLHAGPTDHLLDVGCGTGKPAIRIVRTTGAAVTGVTNSSYQADTAHGAAKAAGLADRARFAHADALDLPYADESFDAAWAMESMVYVTDRPRFLSQIARVLRPGGRLVIADIALRETPQNDEEATTLARFCAAQRIPPLEQVSHFPDLIAQADLRLDDLTDISDHVRPGYKALAAALSTRREEFTATIGEEAFEAFTSTLEAIAAQASYVIVTAIRS